MKDDREYESNRKMLLVYENIFVTNLMSHFSIFVHAFVLQELFSEFVNPVNPLFMSSL